MRASNFFLLICHVAKTVDLLVMTYVEVVEVATVVVALVLKLLAMINVLLIV